MGKTMRALPSTCSWYLRSNCSCVLLFLASLGVVGALLEEELALWWRWGWPRCLTWREVQIPTDRCVRDRVSSCKQDWNLQSTKRDSTIVRSKLDKLDKVEKFVQVDKIRQFGQLGQNWTILTKLDKSDKIGKNWKNWTFWKKWKNWTVWTTFKKLDKLDKIGQVGQVRQVGQVGQVRQVGQYLSKSKNYC